MIERFHIINDNLLRGSAPSEEDLETLKDVWGIKNIISLDEEIGESLTNKCNEIGLNQTILPLSDGNHPNVSKIKDLVQNIEEPTYIHCKHGKDRTGMVCAIYRVLVDGWNKEDALGEAEMIGMGKGLSKSVHDSYYNAVNQVLEDLNDSQDAVSISRDELAAGHNPAYDLSNFPSEQQSFAPFSDPEVDHMNRPASLLNQLEKLANMTKLYRFSMPQLVQDPHWYMTLDAARTAGAKDPEGKMYIATIADDAVIESESLNNKEVIQNAVLNDVDILLFENQDSAYIINFMVVGIEQMDGDVNHIEVGLHSNYDGLADNMIGAEQGPMNGAGFSGGSPWGGLQF